MDPKQFQERLTELAELEPIKPRWLQVRTPDEPIVIERQGQQIDLTKGNPTLTLRIRRLKNTIRVCEDCNELVDRRRVERKLYTSIQPHWRDICTNCNRVRDLEGQFRLTPTEANSYYICELSRLQTKKQSPDK